MLQHVHLDPTSPQVPVMALKLPLIQVESVQKTQSTSPEGLTSDAQPSKVGSAPHRGPLLARAGHLHAAPPS